LAFIYFKIIDIGPKFTLGPSTHFDIVVERIN